MGDKYTGQDLIVSWIYSGGTVTLNTDYRTLSYSPNAEQIDATAGGDAVKNWIAGFVDGDISYSGLMSSGGTAVTNALAENTRGTLIVQPEGTAAGKQKITLPALSMGVRYEWPYNDVVAISVDFKQIGARVDGVN